MSSPAAWLWGIILSLLVLVAIFGGAPAAAAGYDRIERVLRRYSPTITICRSRCPTTRHPQEPVPGPDPKSPPDEVLKVRKSAGGGAVRDRSSCAIEASVVTLTDATAWSYDKNFVICPTSILETLEASRPKAGQPGREHRGLLAAEHVHCDTRTRSQAASGRRPDCRSQRSKLRRWRTSATSPRPPQRADVFPVRSWLRWPALLKNTTPRRSRARLCR